MTKINISIPQPCHENWQATTPADKGKFCDSCQKKVFDFTLSSDREIINAFEKNNNLCGRFLNTQLDRDLVKPKQKSSLWLATTTALISLVGLNEATSQEKAPTEQTDQRPLGKFIATLVKEEIEVSGIVYDENKLPLPGANVVIKGTAVSTQTDFDGKYTIKVQKGDTLIVTFIGFNTLEYEVNQQNINFNMKVDIVSNLTSITVGGICRKRTFFGRIFNSIGNLFK